MRSAGPLLTARSSDEFLPLPAGPAEANATRAVLAAAPSTAASLGMEEGSYLASRLGTAAALLELDRVHGGGFFDVTPDAATDRAAADEQFAARGPVIDVQTHLVRPSRASMAASAALFGFLRMVDPDRWSESIDPELLSAPAWAATVFGGSETAVALLTSPPGRQGENAIDNPDIAAAREIVDRYAGSGRVMTHTIVHPNLGASELDAMTRWSDELRPDGWKVYTLWDPPERPGRGWFLDDLEHGVPFLERVDELGPRLVCAHKGIAGPIPGATPTASSPRDVGPAAAMFPGIEFVVYHSGYDLDPTGEEAEHARDPDRGVSRLVTSLRDAGIPPGANVWAELGSTWYLMLRRPVEAAHVLGKLLGSVGPERIVWGTDSVWYGPPQPLIDAFRAFTIPEWMQERFGYPALTPELKQRILGTNATQLYGIDVPPPAQDPRWLEEARSELARRLA